MDLSSTSLANMSSCRAIGSSFAKTFDDYASGTTVHGIPYIFQKDRPRFERLAISLFEAIPCSTIPYFFLLIIYFRLLWVIVVGLAVSFAVFLSNGAYQNWKSSPVLTTVWTTGHPIEQVPFPSVTICAQGSVNEIIGKLGNYW